MACPCELFSSWMPQSNPGPAFWCSCPRLNADRTLPPPPSRAGQYSWAWARKFESSSVCHTHTFSAPEGCGRAGPRVWLEARISPRKCSLSSSSRAGLTVSTPSHAAGTGLHAGGTLRQGWALHPSRAFASLPIKPGTPCCPRARSLAWGAHPRGYTARVFPGQSWSLGSLWPRSPLEASGPGRQGQTEASPSLAQGQTGQWVSYAARQQGHTSPPLPGLLKIAPPQSSALAPAARMLFFRAGPPCSWCFVFSKRFPWQPGPPALQNGEGSSCHRHSHGPSGAC